MCYNDKKVATYRTDTLVGVGAKHSGAGYERRSGGVLRVALDAGQADACTDCQRTLTCRRVQKTKGPAGPFFMVLFAVHASSLP
jgi:hypothetical protein